MFELVRDDEFALKALSMLEMLVVLIGTAALASLLRTQAWVRVWLHTWMEVTCVLLGLLSLHDTVFLLKENT